MCARSTSPVHEHRPGAGGPGAEREPASPGARVLGVVSRFFETWRFGAFSLSLLAFFNAYIVVLMVWPPSPGVMGRFAADFKKWCFVFDPTTGEVNYFYSASLFLGPAVLGLILLALWGSGIKRALETERRGVLAYVLASLVITVALGTALPQAGLPAVEDDEPAFPAAQLRLSEPAPAFRLVDQNENPVSMADVRGRVALITAAYACCPHTCPLIVKQARDVVDDLNPEQRKDLSVLVVTLDPENDTPKTLGDMARRHRVRAPLFRFLSGTPEDVNPVLDALGVARQRDDKTGVIAHSNVFTLVDRRGRVAYRFSLGDLQQRWMGDALRLLLAETPPTP